MGQNLPAELTMLVHLAQASRRPARSWLASAPRRLYAAKSEGGPEDPFTQGPSYSQWLQSEGVKYQDPHRPKNWLGGQVVESVPFRGLVVSKTYALHPQPFPLNPSFKPPTPISDTVRTNIWNDYMANPGDSSLRRLAQSYGFSIARVDAILRLKGLEQEWIEVRSACTVFASYRGGVLHDEFKSISL